MKKGIWLGLLLALMAGHAWAATNANPTVPLTSSGPCQGGNCPGVPNDPTHPFYSNDQSSSVDGSTTQATGGTAQALFGGATPAHGWKISIPVVIGSISTFACYVSDGTTTPSATTAGSQMVYAGGQYSTEPGQKPFGPVYVNCPSTGQAISAQMW